MTAISPEPVARSVASGVFDPLPPAPRLDTDVLIFANPYSGAGPNRQWVDSFVSRLIGADFRPRVIWDAATRCDVFARAAEQLQPGQTPAHAPWIVAAGGDGSVAAVLNDMAKVGVADWPFATLPVGNENLFARHFGIQRRDPDALIEALRRGWTRPVDLGRIDRAKSDPLRFTLMASAGFDAEVVHRVDRWRNQTAADGQLRRVKLTSYFPHMIGGLKSYPQPAVTLTPADGDHADQAIRGAHAFVFNLPEYGKDLGICRQACADDGLLDFVVFTKPGRVRLLNYLRAAAMGSRHLRRSDVIHGKASRLTFTTDASTPVPLQADGDPAGHVTAESSVTITAEPAALRVVHTTA